MSFTAKAYLQQKLPGQAVITNWHRANVIDWMMVVASEFMTREAFHRSVTYLDTLLSVHTGPPSIFASDTSSSSIDCVLPESSSFCATMFEESLPHFPLLSQSNLQLFGAVCLYLAEKMDNSWVSNVSDVCKTTDNTFTEEEILITELVVLRLLRFNLMVQTPLQIMTKQINQLLQQNEIVDSIKQKEMIVDGACLLDFFLLDSRSMRYSSTCLACSATIVLGEHIGISSQDDLLDPDIFSCVQDLRGIYDSSQLVIQSWSEEMSSTNETDTIDTMYRQTYSEKMYDFFVNFLDEQRDVSKRLSTDLDDSDEVNVTERVWIRRLPWSAYNGSNLVPPCSPHNVCRDIDTSTQLLTPNRARQAEISFCVNQMMIRGQEQLRRYEIVSRLGDGSYGNVSSCVDKFDPNHRLVAMKEFYAIPRRNKYNGLDSYTLREIALLIALKDEPKIIRVLDVILEMRSNLAETCRVYVVLEQFGQDLSKCMEHHELYLNPVWCKKVIKNLLIAVNALHQNRVLHRDLNARNVLVDDDGDVRVVDFGMSRPSLEGDPRYAYTSREVVTIWYRAPELLWGVQKQQYTSAIDMWSVGCLIAEIATGIPMFPADEQDADDPDQHQLACIIQQLGTIPQEVWHNLRESMRCFLSENKRKLTTKGEFGWRSHIDDKDLVDLIDHILIYQPEKRLSAYQALQHKYFLD